MRLSLLFMSQSVDFLIVGGGLAGHILQIELERAGCSTLVIDKKKDNISSVIAAGIVNPIAGKFFTVTWRANEIFSELRSYYQRLEEELGGSFFNALPLKRIFATAGEQNIWLSKAHQEKYKGFCSYEEHEIEGLNNNYGSLVINRGGQMAVTPFLSLCKAKYPNRDERFSHQELQLEDKKYQDINFGNIVFCEGAEVRHNNLFNSLPFTPMKGELLEIETGLEPQDAVLLGPVFMQHVADKIWRIGATYEPNKTSIVPTENKKQEIIEKLEKLLTLPYTITNHYAGVRPATVDRRPIIGKHAEEEAYVFNGFGSKGISLIPIHAKEFVQFVLNDAPLHTEVVIDRF